TTRVVDRDSRGDIGRGDRKGDGHLLEGLHVREARQKFFQALIGGETEPRRSPAAKIGETGGSSDGLHFVKRRTCAIGRADQGADTRTGDYVNRNARFAQHTQNADVRYAACESSGES